MRILQDEHYFYTLYLDENTGEYFLEVVCGTVAIFTIRIKLDKEEIKSIRENPDNVRVLAYQISDAPNNFLHRRV